MVTAPEIGSYRYQTAVFYQLGAVGDIGLVTHASHDKAMGSARMDEMWMWQMMGEGVRRH